MVLFLSASYGRPSEQKYPALALKSNSKNLSEK
jgi:hypothetical protein